MERFASGPKRNYYGKGDVIAYRLRRDGTGVERPVFGANVLMLLYGDAFWPTYTSGDNSHLVATDSMKNFIQRETLRFDGHTLEEYCRYLASAFLATYPHTEGIQVSATDIPYADLPGGAAFSPAGPDRATARVELTASGVVEVTSGIRGLRLLRLGGSAFHGFIRDQYTTLPDLHDRPLHMWLDLEWRYTDAGRAFTSGATVAAVRRLVLEVFRTIESGSIQQVIYQMGTRILAEVPAIADVRLEAQNRTWDTVVEDGRLGVYTDPRPPYGCLGLHLTR